MKAAMQAYVLEGTADAPKGAVTAFDTAKLPADDVTIKVAFSGINYKDAMVAAGAGKMVRNFPHIPGIDLSGEVVEDASGTFRAGQQVLVTGYDLGVGHLGGYGQFARVPKGWVVPLPQGLDLREAMVIGTAGFTAMMSLLAMERNGLKPGQGPILITGATGGVGSIAIELFSRAGYDVTASSGKPDMTDFLKTLGAKEVIGREALLDESKRVMLKETWAGAVDNVGGTTLEYLLRTTKGWGSVALCGLVQSPMYSGSVYPFILRGVNLLGIDSVNCPMSIRLEGWRRMAGPLKPRHLKEIGKTIHLADLPAKLDEILKGGARGRYVLELPA
ncbi:MAG: oxidoreductase [Candidatus Lambdaproteobacteria bacterium]|nr:oxidoreductase [Candidatus Lambdaproteobacteria bacterium]